MKTQIQMIPKSFIIVVTLTVFLIKYENQVIIYLLYFKYVSV